MAAEFSISLVVSAVTGAAVSALSELGGTVKSLSKAGSILQMEHERLGKRIDTAMSNGSKGVGKMIGQYYQLGDSVKRINKIGDFRGKIDTAIENKAQARSDLMNEAQGLLGVAATVVTPIKLAMDFESSMADVKKVVNFDTPQQFKQMEQDILKLTHTIPMAATEISSIVAAGGQAGVAREHLLGFATDAAKMGVAFDMTASDAGTAMATLSNVLKIPIQNIGQLGDAINHLSDSANSNAADIVNVLTRAGGTAKQLELTENQAAALGSTFLSMGKAPELAAQAMEGMLGKMAEMKSGAYDKDLKLLGYGAGEFAKAMNEDAQTAINDFLKRVKELPKDQQYPFLTALFGRNYNDDVMLLANSVDEYTRQQKLLTEVDASGNNKYLGSMTREFENRSKTTANQMFLLKSQLTHLGISVGSVLLPAIAETVGMLMPLVSGLISWAEANPAVVKGIFGVLAGVFAFKAGGLALGFVFNSISSAVLGVIRPFVGFAGMLAKVRAMTQLFSMGKPITALRMLGLSARQAKTAVQIFGKGFGFLKSIPLNPLKALPMLFGAAKGAIMGAVGAVKAFSLSLLTNPVTWVVAGIAAAAFLIYKFWNPLKAFFAGIWDSIKAAAAPIMPIFEAIGNAIQPALDVLGQFFNLTQVGEGNARSLGQTVGGVLVAAFMGLTAPIRGAIAIAKWAWDTLSGLFKGEISVGDIFAGFSKAWEGFLTKIEGWKAKASELWNSFTSLFKGGGDKAVGNAVGGAVSAGGGGFWSSLTSGLESARQTISEKAGGLWDSAKAKFDEAKGTLTTKAGEIWSSVTNVLNGANGVNIGAIIAQTVSGAVSAISGAATTISGVLSAMVQGMSGAFVAIFPVISTAFSGMASVASAGVASLNTVVTAGFAVMRVQVASGWQSLGSAMSGNPMLVRLQMAMGQCIGYLGSVQGRFYAIGLNISQGLARGMQAGLAQIRATATQMMAEVDKASRARMAIKSPSRVMMAIGRDVVAGLDVGMGKQFVPTLKSYQDNLSTLSDPVSSPVLSPLDIRPIKARQGGVGAGEMVIHFNPTINANGSASRDDIHQAVAMSLKEFEKMMKRVEDARRRRAYV